jgi:rhodanese-related sulfurtransferase
MKQVSPDELALLQESTGEWALFDVREAGEADRGHIFGATFLPRRLIEARIADLVGAKGTQIVVYDEGGQRASLATQTLERLGYTEVAVLQGGTRAWAQSGRPLTTGSNVPSKLFGEEVYEHEHVPQLPVATLKAWQDQGKDCVVCDIRTPEEYDAARIPGALGAFGVDLALVAGDLAEKNMPIVVHCAGRTRSIIACQTLRALGVEQVYALENGTMGWQVAGYELERGTPRGVMRASAASAAKGEDGSRRLALGVGAVGIGVTQLREWLADRVAGRANVYAFDVRQLDAYKQGHLPGSAALPGGLAIQRTDEFAPVRNARTVLIDENGARAWLTAFWLRKQGRPQVYVLEGGVNAWVNAGQPVEVGRSRNKPLGLEAARLEVRTVTPAELAAMEPVLAIQVDTSREYANAHLAGAQWIPYGSLEDRIAGLTRGRDTPLILTCHDGVLSTFAAVNLARLGVAGIKVLEGGVGAWVRAGLSVEKGWPAGQEPGGDLVVPPYNSKLESMAHYLAWEQKLTAERRADKKAKA